MNVFSKILQLGYAALMKPLNMWYAHKDAVVTRKFFDNGKATTEEFFFIQIGANDGITNDPIREYILKYGWSGILVEPQKQTFAKLKTNYAGTKNLKFENSVISATQGVVDFYEFPTSSGAHSLFPDEHFKNRGVRGLKSAYTNRKNIGGSKKTQVKSMTFSDLLDKYAVKQVDLLQIDAEGYDFEIIKLIDFSRIKPTLIRFEHTSLSKHERKKCYTYLRSKGYALEIVGSDTFCYLN